MQRNYFQALSATHSLSLPSIFPRHTENFRMVTCINLAVIWVSLSHRYVQTLAYELYVWVSILTTRSSKLSLQCSRYRPSQIFRTIKPN